MPKIHEEIVVLKVYKLVKPGSTSPSLVTDEIAESLANVAEELIGDGVIIEVEKS